MALSNFTHSVDLIFNPSTIEGFHSYILGRDVWLSEAFMYLTQKLLFSSFFAMSKLSQLKGHLHFCNAHYFFKLNNTENMFIASLKDWVTF